VFVEEVVVERPDDDRIYASLGKAYAGLGLKNEAIRAGQTAVQMMPVSRDAFNGPQYIEDLAYIYTRVGEHDTAIDQLEYLLSIPSWISVWLLRIDPRWDPLRNHPRFQRLVE
jgi:serine/threonine-protein kinase